MYVQLLVLYTCLGSVDNSHNNQNFALLIFLNVSTPKESFIITLMSRDGLYPFLCQVPLPWLTNRSLWRMAGARTGDVVIITRKILIKRKAYI